MASKPINAPTSDIHILMPMNYRQPGTAGGTGPLVRETELYVVRGCFRLSRRGGARETDGNAIGVQFCFSAALFAGCHVRSPLTVAFQSNHVCGVMSVQNCSLSLFEQTTPCRPDTFFQDSFHRGEEA